MKAWNLTREAICYRHDAFSAGLRAAGYDVQKGAPGLGDVKPGDLVLGWNRYSVMHEIATRTEKAGGIYLCAENGYVGIGGASPHSMERRDPYALAIGYHNDASAIPDGGPERWAALGVDLAPWRASGGHVLVCPNRAFGTPGRMMPVNWKNEVVGRLQKLTKREIRVRPHPGNSPPEKPLAADLVNCHAVVIWASSVGVHALLAGVPVIAEAPFWICKSITGTANQIETPPMPDRLPALRRLAWGQYFIAEIESGIAFDHLLRTADERKVAARA